MNSNSKYYIIIFLSLLMTNFLGATGIINTILLGLIAPFVIMEIRNKSIFKWEFVIIILGLLFNMIACKYYRDQTILDTFRASANFFYLLFYFVLKYINPSIKQMEKALWILVVIFCSAYIIQYIIYPTVIFRGAKVEYEDDIRIRLAGGGLSSLGIFMGLNKYFVNKDLMGLIIITLGLIVIFLMGFRTMLFGAAVFAFVLLIRTSGFSWKLFFNGVLLFVAFIAILQIPVFAQKINFMLERQVDQNLDNKDYIRIVNFEYYTQHHFKSIWEYIIGSGSPFPETKYGKKMEGLTDIGIYFVDWGLLGLSWIIGILPVLAMIVYSIRTLFIKLDKQYYYFGIWFVYLIATSITTCEFYREGNYIIQGLALFSVELANKKYLSKIERKKIRLSKMNPKINKYYSDYSLSRQHSVNEL